MTRQPAALLLAAALLAACGIPGNTPVGDLDDKQRTSVCEDALKGGPEPGEYDCGGGVTVTIEEPDAEEQADCEEGLAQFGTACPELVVSDILDCFDAQAEGDVCADEPPPECDVLFECIFGG